MDDVKDLYENFAKTRKPEQEVLEDFVFNNTELEELESRLQQFNLFEALGAVNNELRHSNFLGFLLSPNENHGLREVVLKQFCLSFFKLHRDSLKQSLIHADAYDYDSFEVRREWKHIDVLIISESEKLVIAIENKVRSIEHSNQLARYSKLLNAEFSEYSIICCYLTPDGITPEKNQEWLPYSYSDIHELMLITVRKHSHTMSSDIHIFLKHYLEMLERHIMEESDISVLCNTIYKQHKRALDLIFEHKPDSLMETHNHIVSTIENNLPGGFVFDQCSKSYIRLTAERWDNESAQLSGKKQWTKSSRVILFEITNTLDGIIFKLLIGPGDNDFRKSMFESFSNKMEVFKSRSKAIGKKWTTQYKKVIVTKKQMDYDLDSIKGLIFQNLIKVLTSEEFKKICICVDEALHNYTKSYSSVEK